MPTMAEVNDALSRLNAQFGGGGAPIDEEVQRLRESGMSEDQLQAILQRLRQARLSNPAVRLSDILQGLGDEDRRQQEARLEEIRRQHLTATTTAEQETENVRRAQERLTQVQQQAAQAQAAANWHALQVQQATNPQGPPPPPVDNKSTTLTPPPPASTTTTPPPATTTTTPPPPTNTQEAITLPNGDIIGRNDPRFAGAQRYGPYLNYSVADILGMFPGGLPAGWSWADWTRFGGRGFGTAEGYGSSFDPSYLYGHTRGYQPPPPGFPGGTTTTTTAPPPPPPTNPNLITRPPDFSPRSMANPTASLSPNLIARGGTTTTTPPPANTTTTTPPPPPLGLGETTTSNGLDRRAYGPFGAIR